jgi:hypothetical protein
MRGALDYDFSIAIVLFITVYASLYTVLPSFIGGLAEPRQDPYLAEARYFSDRLVLTPGEPQDWSDISLVEKLGLAYYDATYYPNILDYDKVTQLPLQDCGALKEKLGADLDFKISVVTQANTWSCNSTEEPMSPKLVQRMAYLYDGLTYTPARLDFWVY